MVGLFDNKNIAVRIALLVVQALQACLVEQELSALFVGPARYQRRFRPATRQVQVADECRIGIRLHVPAQAWFCLWRRKGIRIGVGLRVCGHVAVLVRKRFRRRRPRDADGGGAGEG